MSELLAFVPDFVGQLFTMIKKAETSNVFFTWEDSSVLIKVSVQHKPLKTSIVREPKKK
jgi:hypothetical protein